MMLERSPCLTVCVADAGTEDLKGEFRAQQEEKTNSGLTTSIRTTGSKRCQEIARREKQQLAVLIEQTEHEIKRKNPERALQYTDKGLKIKPDHIPCLALRCRCYVDLHKYRFDKGQLYKGCPDKLRFQASTHSG